MMKKINSLYIHIPFCDSICDYCDFTKLQYFHNFAVKYIESLKQEIASKNISYKLKTIFIGGGTPTSLEDELFEDLLSYLSTQVDNSTEYSIECNPESLTKTKLEIMKKYGVNRISIGVESTNNNILKSINRKHTFEDVQKAVELARSKGINNINLDLILGLPNVTFNLLEKDIENILSLNPNHISCYGLTVHEHTVFFINGIKPPKDDVLRRMYDLVNLRLTEAGYEHYEVSNWAKPDCECEHNLTYWRDEQYFGCGLGASGYEDSVRYTNTRNLHKYIKDYKEKESEEVVTLSDDKTYYIMTNLRTKYGINLDCYKEKFNEDLLNKNREYLEKLFNSGLAYIQEETNSLICTYEGMMVLDQIILNLI